MTDWVKVSFLPRDLLQTVFEFAGSLSNKRTRLHTWLNMELLIFRCLYPDRYCPSRLLYFYKWHGHNRLKRMFTFDFSGEPYITQAMTKIC